MFRYSDPSFYLPPLVDGKEITNQHRLVALIVKFADRDHTQVFLTRPEVKSSLERRCPNVRFGSIAARNLFAFGNFVLEEGVAEVKLQLASLCRWFKARSLLSSNFRVIDMDFFIGAMQQNT